MSVGPRLDLVTIAPLRFPIREPFAGGLESAVWNEVRSLRARGHRVDVIAVEGSDHLDGGPAAFSLPAPDWGGDPRAADDTYPDGYLERALPALDRAIDEVRRRAGEYDAVLNHCLLGLPLVRAGSLATPMISILHTPVVPALVSAHLSSPGGSSRFLSVSTHTAGAWAQVGIPSDVLPNGADHEVWKQGRGGEGLIWFGRLVPEKGAHLAIEAARILGRPLTLVGRIGDRTYFDREVRPLLGGTVRHIGELRVSELSALVGASACALVTPVWDEPFGLVTPEALLTGTPVAAFAKGGVTELAAGSIGLSLAAPGDPAELARVASELIRRAESTPEFRRSIRQRAVARYSLEHRTDELEQQVRTASGTRGEAA